MKVKEKILNKRGFTLIEILAAVTILGIVTTISITAVTSLLKKAEIEYYKTQEKNMAMSAKSYIDKNEEEAPKVNGAIKEIKLKALEKSKFIDKVVDYHKQDCNSDTSFVSIFKYNDQLQYVTYLECPSYNSAGISTDKNISIDGTYSGGVSTAKFDLTVTDSVSGMAIYYYKIYKDHKLAYTSNPEDAKMTKDPVTKSVSLTDYTPGEIDIVVTAINSKGQSEIQRFPSNSMFKKASDGDAAAKPFCVRTAANENTTWTTEDVTVSVGCTPEPPDPSIESKRIPCIRDEFEKKITVEGQTATITIENIEGGTQECTVDSYIDRSYPSVTLKFYKRSMTGGKADNTVVGSITADDSNHNKTLDVTQGGIGTEKWYNAANYPYGFYIEAEFDDLSPIRRVEWNYNPANVKKSASNYNSLSLSKSEAPNVKNGKVNYYIDGNGQRKGNIKITDSTNHTTIINFTISLDVSSPSTPTGGSLSYSGNAAAQSVSNGSGSTDNLSGVEKYLYCLRNNSSTPSKNDSCFKTNQSYTRACNKSWYGFVIAVDYAGNKSDVRFMGSGYDNANAWGSWSTCTASCAGGTQYRDNACALVSRETRSCNTQSCCSSVYWVNDSSYCTKSCGGGNNRRYSYSNYNGQYCSTDYNGSSCNTQGCCSSVWWSQTGTCSASCDGGRYKRNSYSNYNGQWCGEDWWGDVCNTHSCIPPYASYGCKIRGTTKRTGLSRWTCSNGSHSRHNAAYLHYCSGSDGTLYVSHDYAANMTPLSVVVNRSVASYPYICPQSPYGTAQGWYLISD